MRPIYKSTTTWVGSLIVFFLSLSTYAQQPFPEIAPNDVTREMDRDQMLYQLGITLPELPSKLKDPNSPTGSYPADSLNPEGNWTNKDGDLFVRSAWGLWNNYDDNSKGFFPGPDSTRLGNYEILDLFTAFDGTKITTKEQWWEKRRPELLKEFMDNLYGHIPDPEILPSVSFDVETQVGGTGNGRYIEKQLTGIIDVSRYPEVRDRPMISATLRVPADATGPVPVLVLFGGFRNNVDADWERAYPHGWGVCVFRPNDLQPDNGQYLTSYLIGLVNQGKWRKPDDWGSIAAWSWGISRLIDYFETDSDVDAKAIGLSGHSRYGKATLFAMAVEPRIAIGFPSDGGSLGTTLTRRHWGQDLENSTGSNEYHWMSGTFLNYAGPLNSDQYLPRKVENLKVDSYSLLSLIAPRPVLFNGGNGSTWTDPYGQYLTPKLASPVYEFLGATGLVMNDEKPIIDKAYLEGDLAYRYHDGGHTPAPEWPSFYAFTKKYIKAPILSSNDQAVTLASTDQGISSLTILANQPWRASVDADWVELKKSDFDGDQTLNLATQKNPEADARSAKLTLESEGMKRVILVNQGGVNPQLTISSDQISAKGDKENELFLSVLSNTAWELDTEADWIFPEKEAGINNDKIKISFAANPAVEKRNASIIVTGAGINDPLTISVEQGEGLPTLNVSTNQLMVGAEDGSSAGFWVITNTNWTVETSDEWLKTNVENGQAGFNRASVRLDGNNSTGKRSGQVIIKIPGLEDHIIEVIQKGNTGDYSDASDR